jgi:hypothetical protein
MRQRADDEDSWKQSVQPGENNKWQYISYAYIDDVAVTLFLAF